MSTKKKVIKKKSATKKSLVKAESSLPALSSDATPTQTVMHSLMLSMDRGLEPEQLKMVLDAQERVLDRQAEQDYQAAMMRVQSRVPVISRNRENRQTNSTYADLDHIIKIIRPIYTDEGFALSFGTADSPLNRVDEDALYVRVTCDVMHVTGWSKSLFVDVPLDNVGIKGNVNKTKVHGTGSGMAYGRRYLTALIFNLATGDDDDGNTVRAEPELLISETQIADLESLIEEVGSTVEAFLKTKAYDSLAEIPEIRYGAAIAMLEKKRDMQ